MNKFTLVVLGLALAGVAQADVYKCPRPDGTMTYSQTRCADVAPMDLKVHRPTPEEVLASDLRILEEKYDLEVERNRRYQLWLSGKYLGGHNTYTESVTWQGGGSLGGRGRRYVPEYHHKAPLAQKPQEKRRSLGSSAATMGSSGR